MEKDISVLTLAEVLSFPEGLDSDLVEAEVRKAEEEKERRQDAQLAARLANLRRASHP